MALYFDYFFFPQLCLLILKSPYIVYIFTLYILYIVYNFLLELSFWTLLTEVIFIIFFWLHKELINHTFWLHNKVFFPPKKCLVFFSIQCHFFPYSIFIDLLFYFIFHFVLNERSSYLNSYLKNNKKEIATFSSILAWKIPWVEEPGGRQSMGSQRVGHDSN